VRGDGEIDPCRKQCDGKDNCEEVEEHSVEELHEIRVSGEGSPA